MSGGLICIVGPPIPTLHLLISNKGPCGLLQVAYSANNIQLSKYPKTNAKNEQRDDCANTDKLYVILSLQDFNR